MVCVGVPDDAETGIGNDIPARQCLAVVPEVGCDIVHEVGVNVLERTFLELPVIELESLERDPCADLRCYPFAEGSVKHGFSPSEEVLVTDGVAKECGHTALNGYEPV